MKKFITAAILAALPFLPLAAHDFQAANADSVTLYYNITSDEEVSVTYCSSTTDPDYIEYSGAITIPATVARGDKLYRVTEVGKWAFSGCTALTAVTIPESVLSISENAFSSCTGLTEVTIPDSVTYLGWAAFGHCSGLTSVTIGCSVETLGSFSFTGCDGLTSVTIPPSVTAIGRCAFYGCNALAEVFIPASVTDIDDEAFCNCSSLAAVYSRIPEPGAVYYGDGVFRYAPCTEAWLYVPVGTADKYAYNLTWRPFGHIVEMDFTLPGDANSDDTVDATDIAHVIDHMLGIDHSGFDVRAADLNGDSAIDATDISSIICLILGN